MGTQSRDVEEMADLNPEGLPSECLVGLAGSDLLAWARVLAAELAHHHQACLRCALLQQRPDWQHTLQALTEKVERALLKHSDALIHLKAPFPSLAASSPLRQPSGVAIKAK